MRQIENGSDHERALKEIERYFQVEPEIGSPAADRFDELAVAIATYEDIHFPMRDDVRL